MKPLTPSPNPGMRALALNVIRQALDDLVAVLPTGLTCVCSTPRVDAVREEAFKFCFSPSNGWRGARDAWAGVLGLHGDAITKAAEKKLKAPPKPTYERTKKKPLPSVEEILSLGPTLRLSEIAERFDLDTASAYSAIAKVRENGYRTELAGGRKSGTYAVTPRE